MTQAVAVEKKVWIPEVPEKRIRELAKRIKPVVKFKVLGRCYIKQVDLFNVAYTWSPRARRPATGLKPLCEITTYHTWGYYGFFKPSIAEVMAQIPEEHLDKVVAFEIIKHPETVDDLNRELDALNAGYHVATTRLYAQR